MKKIGEKIVRLWFRDTKWRWVGECVCGCASKCENIWWMMEFEMERLRGEAVKFFNENSIKGFLHHRLHYFIGGSRYECIGWVCESQIWGFVVYLSHASHITLNVFRGRNNDTVIINNQIRNGKKNTVGTQEKKSLESMVHLTLLQQWWRWWWWLRQRRRRRRKTARDYEDDSCRKNTASRKSFCFDGNSCTYIRLVCVRVSDGVR